MIKLVAFVFTKGVSLINALLTSVFIIRYLGAADYGVIAYSVSLSTVLTLLIPLGISSRVSLDLIENKYSPESIITNSLILRGVAVIINLIIVAAICSVFSNILNIKYPLYVFILCIFNFSRLFDILDVYWLAKGNSKLLSNIGILSSLLTLILKFSGIISSAGLFYFILVSSSEVVFKNLGVLVMSLKQNLIKYKKFSISYCISLMKKSYPICGNILFTGLVRNADMVLLGWFAPAQEIGLYSLGKRIASSFDFLSVESVNFFYHKICEKNKNQFRRMYSLGALVILMGLSCSLLLIFSSHFLINTIWGSDFSKSAYILNIFAVFMPFSFWYAYRKKFIVVHNKEKIVFIYSIVTVSALFLTSIVLGSLLGVSGIAYSTGLSFVISTIFAPLVFNQKLETEILFNSFFHVLLPIRLAKKQLISRIQQTI